MINKDFKTLIHPNILAYWKLKGYKLSATYLSSHEEDDYYIFHSTIFDIILLAKVSLDNGTPAIVYTIKDEPGYYTIDYYLRYINLLNFK